MEAFVLSQILSWSPPVIFTLILIALVFLIRQIIKNEKAQVERSNNLRICIEKDLSEIKADTMRTLEDQARRIAYLEMEYVRRNEFYKELGGWREDIHRLSSLVTSQFMDFTKNIIELWKGKGEK